MAQGASPIVGYNTNVRHKNKLYHIQTEDSGVRHPHIITHLFADGGRVVASKKTSYAEHVDRPDMAQIVKQLMQAQHKAMFIALRDGVYDEEAAPQAPQPAATPQAGPDIAALEHAASARAAESPALAESATPAGRGRYQSTVPAHSGRPSPGADVPSPFGDPVPDDQSLDELILNYLAEEAKKSDK